ncbi:MAG TPA: DUF58 domain-containing protein [Polyangiales bacterium]|nr:DUF58 domain-containing protein [Polyangiales bacterium]
MKTPERGVVAQLDTLVRLRVAARDIDFLPRQPHRSLLAGRRASKLRGRGMDFEELRAYVPGDDVRCMDWHATMRLGRPFVRTYREERDRPLMLLVDQRRGMFFGSREKMKSVVAAELAALVAWCATAHGDRVGALLFGEAQTRTFRPTRSEAQVQRICEGLVQSTEELVTAEPGARDAFVDAARACLRLAAHDALLVVISDFRALSDEALVLLRRLREHNDLLLAWITDPLEKSLPERGSLPVTDGERRFALPTAEPGFRSAFAAEFAHERQRFEEFVRRSGGIGFELSSDQEPAERLREVLGRRASGAAR